MTNELQLSNNEIGRWEVYINGSPKAEFDTYKEAKAYALKWIAKFGGELFE